MINLFKQIYSYDLVHSHQYQLLFLIIFILFWCILLFLIQKCFPLTILKSKIHDTHNRIISIIHGLTTFILASSIYFQPQITV